MAWFVPIVASKRRGRRSNPGGIIAGLVIFLIFGVLFFVFFNRSGMFGFNFPMIFIIVGFGVFIMIILGVSIAASSMSKVYKTQKVNIHGQTSQQNPYVIREPIQNHPEPQSQEKPTEDVPIVNEINYCRYCGGKIDREARFCHQCGSKL
ncbi:MAG: hypothetical protein ACW96X_11490 [Promethearchaeota archaeon]|jgi:protein-S-isoprenylcysteine O-methyltransferase Ste14